ncbi:MAG: Crp/Fnr family transcriptional regulator, partial [Bacteroidales bacterium]
MKEEQKQLSCDQCVYRSWAFEKLTLEQLLEIDKSRNEFSYNKGEVICEEGEEVKSFLYLQKGLVKLLQTEKNEKEHIISIAKPLDFIGLLSIFSNEKHIYTITAIEDSIICEVDLKLIKRLMRENGDFALDFVEKMSKVADDVIHTRLSINTKQLRGRIAYILLFFAEHIYGKNEYELPVSRKEIAQLIDMSTENVIRILSEFRKDNIISIEGKNIHIHDSER